MTEKLMTLKGSQLPKFYNSQNGNQNSHRTESRIVTELKPEYSDDRKLRKRDDAHVMMWQRMPPVSKTSENLKGSKRKMDTDGGDASTMVYLVSAITKRSDNPSM